MSIIHQEKTTFSSICQICGEPAQYAYFGVISCPSCKMFFKRNATIDKSKFKCDLDGQCEININNRHICKRCRLEKCFQSGMSIDTFQSTRQRRKTHLNIISTTTKTLQFPTLNLLRSDTSLMNQDQWTLLTNIIHAYDDINICLVIKDWMNNVNISQIQPIIKTTSLDEVFSAVYQTAGKFLRSNHDLYELFTDNRSIIIRNMTDSVTCLGGTLAFSQSQLISDEYFWNIFIDKYGLTTKNLTYYAMKFVDLDGILMKLGFCLLACSQHHSIFCTNRINDDLDTIVVFRMQNTYAELTWKYLLYKYGYRESIMRYVTLIQCLMSVIVAMGHVQSVQAHINEIDLVADKIEIDLVVDDIERMTETIS